MRNILIVFILFSIFTSCDSNHKFDSYQSIKDNIWLQENSIEFHIKNKDTISKNNLFINLRNNKEYEFSNLFLIAKIDFPNGFRVIDTLEYEMTDKLGVFLGKGYTDIKENKLFYKENVRFNQLGDYTVQIEQAMRKNGNIKGLDSLKGITDVGFRIEKITE